MSERVQQDEYVDFLLTPAQAKYLEWGVWEPGVSPEEKTAGVCFAAALLAVRNPLYTMVVLISHGTKEERRILLQKVLQAVDTACAYEPLTETFYLSNGAKVLMAPRESKATLTEAVKQDNALAGAGMMFFED